MMNFVKRVKRWIGDRRGDVFLSKVRGVVHVGANLGQERHRYQARSLDVIWVEPIPEIFSQLQRNVAPYERQRAFQYLVTDKIGGSYDFHIANNEGQSSSILDLEQHKDIWPDVKFERTITLESVTLAAIVERERVDMSRYDALVMDTQGSELLVLKGAEALLRHFRYIKTEAADFEAYKGCCTVDDLTVYLSSHGFAPVRKGRFASRKLGGSYYDVLYQRKPGS